MHMLFLYDCHAWAIFCVSPADDSASKGMYVCLYVCMSVCISAVRSCFSISPDKSGSHKGSASVYVLVLSSFRYSCFHIFMWIYVCMYLGRADVVSRNRLGRFK
jgi:hypothetical protein